MATSLPLTPLQKEQGFRNVLPEEMIAIKTKRDTKIVTKDEAGVEKQITIPKDTEGYMVCKDSSRQGNILAQLIDCKRNLCRVSIREDDVDKGPKHTFRVEPRPPLEEGQDPRREWLRYQVINGDGRMMSVFRTPSVVVMHNGVPKFTIKIPAAFEPEALSWTMALTFEHSPSPPPPGTPIVVSVQAMNDGKPHEVTWFRAPLHGGWTNFAELSSFGICAEWFDKQLQKRVACWFQNNKMFPRKGRLLPAANDQYHPHQKDLSINDPYVMASRVMQFVRNYKYQNPPNFLAPEVNPDVKDVVWDHMAQTMRLIPRRTTIDRAAPRRATFLENWTYMAVMWPDLLLGGKPDANYAKDWVCAVSHALNGTRMPTSGGSIRIKYKPITAAEIDPAEIVGLDMTTEQVAAETCHVCWSAYRRPCAWVEKHAFSKTSNLDGHNAVNILPDYPGLVPSPYLPPRSHVVAETLPEYKPYETKGELDDWNEDWADFFNDCRDENAGGDFVDMD
ncbi:hypothetical protein CkaCkLH20_04801 [Colletotrichum karsti]|uniref:Uncharacterized protein n=1 Tax=Colletotrichum karsti TaxID=1095194 RepID=A0A9P6LLZ6_9PEZI|nr:uncharacterized protein CkaCkLH20_04801 [Colletotrichum karsti]KAF9877666.1 hypothetical protein CkaCkLH20_04801 [Colletotrichum karsti]